MGTEAYIEMVYRNLKGELSPEEFAALNEFTAKNTEYAALRSEIEEVWDVSGEMPNLVNENETSELVERITKKEVKTSFFTLRRVLSGIAAIFILAFGVFWLNTGTTKVYTGEGGVLTLEDNSKVELREGSQLKVNRFGRNSRNVELIGEAFFNVETDIDRPFIISTATTKIEVLGTSFLVKEYKNSVFVHLTEGKVRFSDQKTGETVDMTAPMKVEYNLNDGMKEVEYNNLGAWKEGVFQFQDQPLSSVIQEMEIVFETSILVSNPELLNCRINAILTAEFIELAINQLASELKMNAKKDGQNWVLSEGECN